MLVLAIIFGLNHGEVSIDFTGNRGCEARGAVPGYVDTECVRRCGCS